MSIFLRCADCQARLSVGHHKAGSDVQCPKCQKTLIVPQNSEEGLVTNPAERKDNLLALTDNFEPGNVPNIGKPVVPGVAPRYLLVGGVAAVLLCMGIYAIVAALSNGDGSDQKEERVVNLDDDKKHLDPKPIDPTPRDPSFEAPKGVPQLVLTKPRPKEEPKEKPKEEPKEKPKEEPKEEPKDKKPDYTPPKEDPKEKPKEEPKPEPKKDPPVVKPVPKELVVKRRQQLDAEGLRKQLLNMRELHIDTAKGTSTQLVALATQLKQLNRPYPGPTHFMGRRDDLAGLPMRMGQDCHLGKEPAENLQVLSRKLRVLLEMSIPKDGIDTRPDPEVLRDLLIEGKMPENELIAKRFPGLRIEGKPRDWLTAEAVPALMQLLQAENTSVRKVLVEVLGKIRGNVASEALANRALMDQAPEVRELALVELQKRPLDEFAQHLVKGLRYPWAPVADHAAEALVALELRETIPSIVRSINEPDVGLPITVGKGISAYPAVREVVRINHLGNCVLCHAPSTSRDEMVRGAVPTPGQALPAPVTTPQYYERGGTFVRADITYLKQDFSVVQPVENNGPWPVNQRFDYLVRQRPATPADVAQLSRADRKPSPQRESMLYALRELSGKDLGNKPEGWKVLLLDEPPKKPPTP